MHSQSAQYLILLINKRDYLESMKFLRLSRNHFPPILLIYVGALMLMATLVRCLSKKQVSLYIDYRCQGCHSASGRIEQNHFYRDRPSMDCMKCIKHRCAYRIFFPRRVKGLKYNVDKHSFPLLTICSRFSILKFPQSC